MEWFNTVDEAKVLNDIKDDFLDRFTDGRDKFKHRLEVENASRQEGEIIKNYFLIFIESSTLLIKVGQKI